MDASTLSRLGFAHNPPPSANVQSGGQGSVDLNLQLQNLNMDYSSEKRQALQLLGVGAVLMLGGAFTSSTGIFLVGVLFALFGYSRYNSNLTTLAARDAVAAQLVSGAEVKV